MSLYVNLNFSSTKSGPGRVHRDGTKKAKPVKQRGAPLGFAQRQASEEKRRRRDAVKLYGIRKFKRLTQTYRPENALLF